MYIRHTRLLGATSLVRRVGIWSLGKIRYGNAHSLDGDPGGEGGSGGKAASLLISSFLLPVCTLRREMSQGIAGAQLFCPQLYRTPPAPFGLFIPNTELAKAAR